MRLDQTSSDRLDLLRFPLIVGVVLIHASETDIDLARESLTGSSSIWLYHLVRNLISEGVARTAVPLFYLMSGYLFFAGYAGSVAEFQRKIRSRIKTLAAPFLFWNVLTLALLMLAQALPSSPIYTSDEEPIISAFGFYEYFDAIIGIDRNPISYQFWFIRDLMMLVLLAPITGFLVSRMPIAALPTVLALWFFDLWPIDVPSAAAFAFFCAGAYLATAKKSLFFADKLGPTILCFYLSILLVDVFTKNSPFNSHIHQFGIFLGVGSALYISRMLIAMDKFKTVLLRSGECSFFVFAAHEPLLSVIRKTAHNIFPLTSGAAMLAAYFLIPAIVVTVCIIMYSFTKAVAPGFLSIIAGGRYRERQNQNTPPPDLAVQYRA